MTPDLDEYTKTTLDTKKDKWKEVWFFYSLSIVITLLVFTFFYVLIYEVPVSPRLRIENLSNYEKVIWANRYNVLDSGLLGYSTAALVFLIGTFTSSKKLDPISNGTNLVLNRLYQTSGYIFSIIFNALAFSSIFHMIRLSNLSHIGTAALYIFTAIIFTTLAAAVPQNREEITEQIHSSEASIKRLGALLASYLSPGNYSPDKPPSTRPFRMKMKNLAWLTVLTPIIWGLIQILDNGINGNLSGGAAWATVSITIFVSFYFLVFSYISLELRVDLYFTAARKHGKGRGGKLRGWVPRLTVRFMVFMLYVTLFITMVLIPIGLRVPTDAEFILLSATLIGALIYSAFRNRSNETVKRLSFALCQKRLLGAIEVWDKQNKTKKTIDRSAENQ